MRLLRNYNLTTFIMGTIVETGRNYTLAQKINSTDALTTVKLSDVPETATAGVLRFGSGNNVEWMSFNAVSTGNKTVTINTRGLKKNATSLTDGDSSIQKDFAIGTPVRLVEHSIQVNNKMELDEDGTNSADNTWTGINTYSGTTKALMVLQNVTTAQRDALTGVANGTPIYNTTLGQTQWREGGAWVTNAAGGTVADASETVAGKVELSTQAENDAGTATGGTGASLSGTPARNAASVQNAAWTFAADAEASDTYAITLTPAPADYATGQEFSFTANTANTGAATLNVNALGAKTIKKYHDEDLQDGDIESGSLVTVKYDGTNMQLQTSVGANMSEANTFFGATDMSGAEAETLTDGSDASSLHVHAKVVKQTTRALTTATGTEDIAHGLGRTPKSVTAFATYASSTSAVKEAEAGNSSMGWSDGSNDFCSHVGTEDREGSNPWARGAGAGNSATKCIFIQHEEGGNSGSGRQRRQDANITFDATNVTLNWTLTEANTPAEAGNVFVTLIIE